MDLPLALRTSLESGTPVLFLGAGIGSNSIRSDGTAAPMSSDLADSLVTEFAIADAGTADLSKVAQIVELRKGRAELVACLTTQLADLEPDASLKWLVSQRWSAIFTTNYDRVIERAYELVPGAPQIPISISATSELVEFDPRFEIPIYHLHGALFGGSRPDILITQEDYAKYSERRRMLFNILKSRFATTPFLYVGYSQNDPNWHSIQQEMRAEFAPSLPPPSFRVAPNTSALDREILTSMSVTTIDGTLDDLVAAARAASIDVSGSADRLQAIESSVPDDLLPAFRKNPAATARLLSSWEYVNAAPFHEAPNIAEYLLGDLPNWGLIASNGVFERDIEEPLFDELLDFATSEHHRPVSILLLAPAGYGVTTVLGRMAARLVKDQAGPVFLHRRGTPLVEGDIEFATTALQQRPFFLVDNAADGASAVISAVQGLRAKKMGACFLMGERVNEWRRGHWHISPVEFEIDALSDVEIDKLLAYLGRNSALNKLDGLDLNLQRAAIKDKHEKQLLVAMREATEGLGFDAIIEDEFRNIKSEVARRLYAAVCCFYRLRVPVRMELLAAILSLPLVDLYAEVGPEIQGIVRVDAVDESKGLYAARARHAIIAEIVWERILEPGERDQLLLKALDELNITYALDVSAFESFFRDDRGVDGIGTFDDKVRFFEQAVRKDPDNPYVLQHYARMLRREHKHETALAVIDKALEFDEASRVLYHTKGLILSDLALTVTSDEIARRRLRQGEASLKRSFGPQKRDPYVYSALAELYLGWAERTSGPEAAEYILRSEETIRDGLATVDEKEGLWLVSAKVEGFLGKQPEALGALRQAVKENTTSAVARYLLARSLMGTESWREVIEVLRPVVAEDTQEFRCAIVLAQAMERIGEPYDKSVAVLRLADLYGRRDARFVAMLGGMLVMAGELTEAEKLFAEVAKSNMSYRELTRLGYVPHPNGGPPPRLDGIATTVRPGYAFIRVPGYPDFFAPASNYRGIEMRRDLKFSLEPGFTARGPIARALQASD